MSDNVNKCKTCSDLPPWLLLRSRGSSSVTLLCSARPCRSGGRGRSVFINHRGASERASGERRSALSAAARRHSPPSRPLHCATGKHKIFRTRLSERFIVISRCLKMRGNAPAVSATFCVYGRQAMLPSSCRMYMQHGAGSHGGFWLK